MKHQVKRLVCWLNDEGRLGNTLCFIGCLPVVIVVGPFVFTWLGCEWCWRRISKWAEEE